MANSKYNIQDSCVGDSGSALMRDEVGSIVPQFSLIGIVSFGPRHVFYDFTFAEKHMRIK